MQYVFRIREHPSGFAWLMQRDALSCIVLSGLVWSYGARNELLPYVPLTVSNTDCNYGTQCA